MVADFFARLFQPQIPAAPCVCALRTLEANTLTEARREARRVLGQARRCKRCVGLLEHVFERIGSTLFIDDDPAVLMSAFPPAECDGFTRRVLAALIVLNGRQRISAP